MPFDIFQTSQPVNERVNTLNTELVLDLPIILHFHVHRPPYWRPQAIRKNESFMRFGVSMHFDVLFGFGLLPSLPMLLLMAFREVSPDGYDRDWSDDIRSHNYMCVCWIQCLPNGKGHLYRRYAHNARRLHAHTISPLLQRQPKAVET